MKVHVSYTTRVDDFWQNGTSLDDDIIHDLQLAEEAAEEEYDEAECG